MDHLLWAYAWSPEKRLAWIMDGEGFTVIPPSLTMKAAAKLVAAHNKAIREAGR